MSGVLYHFCAMQVDVLGRVNYQHGTIRCDKAIETDADYDETKNTIRKDFTPPEGVIITSLTRLTWETIMSDTCRWSPVDDGKPWLRPIMKIGCLQGECYMPRDLVGNDVKRGEFSVVYRFCPFCGGHIIVGKGDQS